MSDACDKIRAILDAEPGATIEGEVCPDWQVSIPHSGTPLHIYVNDSYTPAQAILLADEIRRSAIDAANWPKEDPR